MTPYLSMWLAILLALMPAHCFADVIFESGTRGPIGISIDEIGGGTTPGGAVVSGVAFDGVRFEMTQTVITTRVGGHFVADPPLGTSFFGAIVRLDDDMDFPNSGDLSTPDILGATLLTFPNPSAEVFGDLQVRLDPGWYALVFGSGLFGATGRGGSLLNNPDIGMPDYIGFQPGFGWYSFAEIGGFFKNFRLVVEGNFVPEPTSKIMAICAAALSLSIVRIRR
jgi:hypothetical protein